MNNIDGRNDGIFLHPIDNINTAPPPRVMKRFVVHEERRPVPLVPKKVMLVSAFDPLADIAIYVIQEETKYKDFQRNRLSKITWGGLDVTDCLDTSLRDVEEQVLDPDMTKKEIHVFIKGDGGVPKKILMLIMCYSQHKSRLYIF